LSWQELSASTVKVAMLLGLFAPAYMVWGLVEEVTAQLIDEGDLHEGRKQLNNLYLIKAIDQERTRFALHPLVREFFRYKLVISDSITKQNIYYLVLGIIKYDVVLAKSLVVSELEKFNPFFDNSIKSIDYARLIRESRRSWYEGFGVLAQMIGITSPDGSLPKIGSYIYNSDEATESKTFYMQTIMARNTTNTLNFQKKFSFFTAKSYLISYLKKRDSLLLLHLLGIRTLIFR
jgi:hypothetical protein